MKFRNIGSTYQLMHKPFLHYAGLGTGVPPIKIDPNLLINSNNEPIENEFSVYVSSKKFISLEAVLDDTDRVLLFAGSDSSVWTIDKYTSGKVLQISTYNTANAVCILEPGQHIVLYSASIQKYYVYGYDGTEVYRNIYTSAEWESFWSVPSSKL